MPCQQQVTPHTTKPRQREVSKAGRVPPCLGQLPLFSMSQLLRQCGAPYIPQTGRCHQPSCEAEHQLSHTRKPGMYQGRHPFPAQPAISLTPLSTRAPQFQGCQGLVHSWCCRTKSLLRMFKLVWFHYQFTAPRVSGGAAVRWHL